MLLDRRPFFGMLAMVILCFCGVTAYILWELRQQTWKGALREADNLLVALSQDIERNIEIYDLSLQAVSDGLRIPGIAEVSPEMRKAVLFDRAATARYLGAILLLDEAGQVTDDAGAALAPGYSFQHRDYFTVHRATPDLGLYISSPFRRLTGSDEQAIAFSRRIDRPDGSFGGVVVGTLRLDYFRMLFDPVSLGRQGAVTLMHGNGTFINRAPFDARLIGRSLAGTETMSRLSNGPAGRYTAISTVDGVSRTTSYRRIGQLPLILAVSISPHDVLATWNWRAAGIAGLLLLVCLAAGLLGLLLFRELRRRVRAEAGTREREAELRLLTDNATDVIVRLDASLVRRYVSPSCKAVLGYQVDELVGRSVHGTIHPDDRADVLDRIAQARHEGRTTATYRILHHDGGHVWVEAQYAHMPGNGGFTVVMRDVGLRKAAEAQLAAAHAELARIAMTDGLTGLANRRRFDEALAHEWARAARERQPLTLLLLDVDHFKRFNDRYGHHEGDACLRAIAGALARCMRRPADLAARYGGEEFAILLPGTARPDAAAVGEAVRAAVAALAMPHAGNEAGIVTISVGAATVQPLPRPQAHDPRPGISAFIVAADRLLYAAKERGRNQVASQDATPNDPALRLAVGP